jgi:hypothetical protein
MHALPEWHMAKGTHHEAGQARRHVPAQQQPSALPACPAVAAAQARSDTLPLGLTQPGVPQAQVQTGASITKNSEQRAYAAVASAGSSMPG